MFSTEVFIKQAVTKMMHIAGYDVSYEDLLKETSVYKEPWYSRYTMTRDQESLFRDWFLRNLPKSWSKYKKEKLFNYFILDRGLKYKE